LTTVEAKRQRNRDAQAAFRERRMEYVKELENDMKLLQAEVQELRATRSSSADETLMLRYENSFLTRLLIEHGNDYNLICSYPEPVLICDRRGCSGITRKC
jgi:hypothetical protein